jgi:hypothetical protein
MASEIKCGVKRNVKTLMPHFLHTQHTLFLSLVFLTISGEMRARKMRAGREEWAGVFVLYLVVSKQWRRFVKQIFRRAEEGAPTAKFSGLRSQGFVSETLRAFCLGMLSQSCDSLIEKVCFLRYNRRFRQLFWAKVFLITARYVWGFQRDRPD